MKVQEIKKAVDEGKTVCWSHEGYEVQKPFSEYLVVCLSNQSCIGLTWKDGVTMNGKEEQFFIKEQK